MQSKICNTNKKKMPQNQGKNQNVIKTGKSKNPTKNNQKIIPKKKRNN